MCLSRGLIVYDCCWLLIPFFPQFIEIQNMFSLNSILSIKLDLDLIKAVHEKNKQNCE